MAGSVNFGTSLMGYRKADVDDYVARTESELDIQEKRQNAWNEDMEKLKEDIRQLQRRLEQEQDEKQELLQKQKAMDIDIENYKEELKQQEKKYTQLKTEYNDYRSRMEEEGADPKIIQDAILNAQRMSDIVIVEAQQKALDIREKASQERQEKEEEGKQLIEHAKAEAHKVTKAAEERCHSLQDQYDRILMDVTGFKAELLKMYRKHMELLAALPQKDVVEIEVAEEIPEEKNVTKN